MLISAALSKLVTKDRKVLSWVNRHKEYVVYTHRICGIKYKQIGAIEDRVL